MRVFHELLWDRFYLGWVVVIFQWIGIMKAGVTLIAIEVEDFIWVLLFFQDYGFVACVIINNNYKKKIIISLLNRIWEFV